MLLTETPSPPIKPSLVQIPPDIFSSSLGRKQVARFLESCWKTRSAFRYALRWTGECGPPSRHGIIEVRIEQTRLSTWKGHRWPRLICEGNLNWRECVAEGEYYCDKATHEPPPEGVTYHAELKEGSTAFGRTTWECCRCGALIAGTPEIVD